MPVAALVLGYNGLIQDGKKVLAPARRFGRPAADLVGPMPYRVRRTMLADPSAAAGPVCSVAGCSPPPASSSGHR